MKLKNLIAMSMASLAMFSCAKDSEEVIETGETRTVSFNVSFDASRLGTKADDTSKLFYCFNQETKEVKDATVSGNSATINETVVIGQDYTFNFWLSGGGDKSKFDGTYTTDLDNEDSFYASTPISVSEIMAPVDVPLTRPYAKIQVLSQGVDKVAESAEIEIEGLGTKFDVSTGKVVIDKENPLYIKKTYTPGSSIVAEAFGFIDSSITSATVKVTANNKVFVKTVKVLPNTTTEIWVDDFSGTNPTFNIILSKEWNKLTSDIEAKADLEISNLEELKAFRDEVNNGNSYKGKVIKLIADIELGIWTPIGNVDNPFEGTFDGQKYTINNLKATNYMGIKNYMGFFGNVNNGVISNITFSNVSLDLTKGEVDYYVGIVAGYVDNNTTINNININGDLKLYSTYGHYFGSVIGYGGNNCSYSNITISPKSSSSKITAQRYVGFFAGYLGANTKCYNISFDKSMGLKSSMSSSNDIGGFVHTANPGSEFVNCEMIKCFTVVGENVYYTFIPGASSSKDIKIINCKLNDEIINIES